MTLRASAPRLLVNRRRYPPSPRDRLFRRTSRISRRLSGMRATACSRRQFRSPRGMPCYATCVVARAGERSAVPSAMPTRGGEWRGPDPARSPMSTLPIAMWSALRGAGCNKGAMPRLTTIPAVRGAEDMMSQCRTESRPMGNLYSPPLPARGQGTLPEPARQQPRRRRLRRTWQPLRGREWRLDFKLSASHARPAWLSVAKPPEVPPLVALRQWRTQAPRRAFRGG